MHQSTRRQATFTLQDTRYWHVDLIFTFHATTGSEVVIVDTEHVLLDAIDRRLNRRTPYSNCKLLVRSCVVDRAPLRSRFDKSAICGFDLWLASKGVKLSKVRFRNKLSQFQQASIGVRNPHTWMHEYLTLS